MTPEQLALAKAAHDMQCSCEYCDTFGCPFAKAILAAERCAELKAKSQKRRPLLVRANRGLAKENAALKARCAELEAECDRFSATYCRLRERHEALKARCAELLK